MDTWAQVPDECKYSMNEVYVQYPGFIVRSDQMELVENTWMISEHSVVSLGPQLSMASSVMSEVSTAAVARCMDVAYLQLMAGVHTSSSLRANGPYATKQRGLQLGTDAAAHERPFLI